jgi:peptidoglycan hydrolase CwlO-like protein
MVAVFEQASSEDSIESLRARIADLERVAADLKRHNQELRMAIAALMAPPGGKPDGTEA